MRAVTAAKSMLRHERLTVTAAIDAVAAALGACGVSCATDVARDAVLALDERNFAVVAVRAPAPEAADTLRSRVAFEIGLPVPGCYHAECAVRIPKDAADYRTGRAIVYQLAAKAEALGLRETWAMDVDVRLADGSKAAAGVRGWVTVTIHSDSADAQHARRHLRTTAAAVLPEIKAVV